jgi:hypothetical protein
MQYEVRYQVDGNEFATTVEAEDAAAAAQTVQGQHHSGEESFELIQVHLLDEPGDAEAFETQSDDDLILE